MKFMKKDNGKLMNIKQYSIVFDNGTYLELHSTYDNYENAIYELKGIRDKNPPNRLNWEIVEIRPYSNKEKE